MASGNVLVGDQVAAAASEAAARVPAVRQARPIDVSTVTGSPAERLRMHEDAIDAAVERARVSVASAKTRFVVEVGTSLAEIQKEHLYKVTHSSFEAYVEERFQLSRQRAYQLLEAAPVMLEVSKIFDIPIVESHARILAPIIDEHGLDAVKTVLATAQERGKVTAKSLKEASRESGFTPAAPAARPARVSRPSRDVFERLEEARERLARVSGVVTQTAIHEAGAAHAAHGARLVRDLTAQVTTIATALGLTVSRDSEPLS